MTTAASDQKIVPRQLAAVPALRAADQGVADALESVLSDNTKRVYGALDNDKRGYDKRGYDKIGVHRNETLFDRDGYDAAGYDGDGYDRDGYHPYDD